MDAFQYFGNDLVVSNVGDITLASGIVLTNQRVLRRLLTVPGTYIQNPTFGGGLPAYIGLPLTAALNNEIIGVITTQMYLETTVAQTPAPVISLSANQTALFCNIQYTDAATKTLQVLSFSVTN